MLFVAITLLAVIATIPWRQFLTVLFWHNIVPEVESISIPEGLPPWVVTKSRTRLFLTAPALAVTTSIPLQSEPEFNTPTIIFFSIKQLSFNTRNARQYA